MLANSSKLATCPPGGICPVITLTESIMIQLERAEKRFGAFTVPFIVHYQTSKREGFRRFENRDSAMKFATEILHELLFYGLKIG